MALFAKFKTPKEWTGVIVKKGAHTSTDSEGDSETGFTVTVKLDSEDGLDRERTINVPRELYDKAQVGNEVIKSAENKHPVIQLGTSRGTTS